MKRILTIAAILILFQKVTAQTAYRIYTKEGKEIKFEKMVKSMAKSDVVLLGELHSNPICHWIQLRITQGVFSNNNNMVIGAEMFEADNQLLLNEYLSGAIRTKDFENEVRLWGNYHTDYKPLVEFANENRLQFVATNIPRRYAAMVNSKGLNSLNNLSDEAKNYIAPLPIEVDSDNPSVLKMKTLDFGHPMPEEMLKNMINAQAIKDATMAYFISTNMTRKGVFIHYQGDFHSANYGGIYWYLKKIDENLNIKTMASAEGEGGLEFKEEYAEMGDYILVIANDMTQTNR